VTSLAVGDVAFFILERFSLLRPFGSQMEVVGRTLLRETTLNMVDLFLLKAFVYGLYKPFWTRNIWLQL